MDGARNMDRILIIGKAGNGKSSLGNAILGQRRFPVGRGMSCTTTRAQKEFVCRKGHNILVVDTGDITNLGLTPREMLNEVDLWKRLVQPCPTLVLLAVRCDVRYTAEEYDIYRQIVELWGDCDSFKSCLVVAFTFGDLQDVPIDEELKGVCRELQTVLDDAGRRYVVFNNRAKDVETQVDHLMNLLEAGLPSWTRRSSEGGPSGLYRALCLITCFSGFMFAATYTASHNNWAFVCGLISCVSGISAALLKMTKR